MQGQCPAASWHRDKTAHKNAAQRNPRRQPATHLGPPPSCLGPCRARLLPCRGPCRGPGPCLRLARRLTCRRWPCPPPAWPRVPRCGRGCPTWRAPPLPARCSGPAHPCRPCPSWPAAGGWARRCACCRPPWLAPTWAGARACRPTRPRSSSCQPPARGRGWRSRCGPSGAARPWRPLALLPVPAPAARSGACRQSYCCSRRQLRRPWRPAGRAGGVRQCSGWQAGLATGTGVKRSRPGPPGAARERRRAADCDADRCKGRMGREPAPAAAAATQARPSHAGALRALARRRIRYCYAPKC